MIIVKHQHQHQQQKFPRTKENYYEYLYEWLLLSPLRGSKGCDAQLAKILSGTQDLFGEDRPLSSFQN